MVGGDQSQFKLNSILKDIQKYKLEYVEFTETIACLTESPDIVSARSELSESSDS